MLLAEIMCSGKDEAAKIMKLLIHPEVYPTIRGVSSLASIERPGEGSAHFSGQHYEVSIRIHFIFVFIPDRL